jgi:hypothetical protein
VDGGCIEVKEVKELGGIKDVQKKSRHRGDVLTLPLVS